MTAATPRGATASDASSPFATIEEAIDDIRAGRFVVVSTPHRENEGDLVIAAEFVTPDVVNFMAKHGRGIVCLGLTDERCDLLGLKPMTRNNQSRFGADFTVSIEAREGVTTGISAADRARTIQVAIDPAKGPDDLRWPGHVFPLRARPGGVLERAGATEAAVDLARLPGLLPAAAICQVMNDDGTMARIPDLVQYCAHHGLKLVTVDDLIEYRSRTERIVKRHTTVRVPTAYGEFQAVSFHEPLTGRVHVALVMGEVEGVDNVLVRVHTGCLMGDLFRSARCGCGERLSLALTRIAAAGQGVLVYLSHDHGGTDLREKLEAYDRLDRGLAEPDGLEHPGQPPDMREYAIGSQILAELGLTTIRILSNTRRRFDGIGGFGLEVVAQVPLSEPERPEPPAAAA